MSAMKTRFFTLLLTILVSQVSCSSDDNSGQQEIIEDPVNAFVFDGILFDVQTVWIFDENTSNDEPSKIGINLFNKTTAEISSGEDLEDITAIYFALTDDVLKAASYDTAAEYEFFVNGSVSEGSYDRGTLILDYANDSKIATEIQITITSFTSTEIALDFSFKRIDGKTIYGNYTGTYLDLNQ